MEPAERKQKIIRSINSYLNKLSEKQLRIILLAVFEFDKVPKKHDTIL